MAPILAEFYRVVADLAQAPAPPTLADGSVLHAVAKFLAWCQEHRAPETDEWYRWRL